MGLIEAPGAMLQHFHQPRFIQYGIRIGGACQAGDTTGHRRSHFGFEGGFVFKTRFAQPRR